MEQKQESIHITLTHFQQHEFKVIWRINPLKCLSAYVCVCDTIKEHVVANSALYVAIVNGRDAPK